MTIAKATSETISIISNTNFKVLDFTGITDRIDQFFTGLAFNPVTARMAESCKGSPYDIPIEPAIWTEQITTWASDDQKIREVDGISDLIFLNDGPSMIPSVFKPI